MTKDKPSIMGRPLKFQNLADLQKQIDGFFANCDATDTPYTITGLALALDTTRQSLCDYENRQDFADTIKKAKARVENYAERKLMSGMPAAGPIFALKNYGWSDKVEQQLSGPDGGPIKTEYTINQTDAEILARWKQTQNEEK